MYHLIINNVCYYSIELHVKCIRGPLWKCKLYLISWNFFLVLQKITTQPYQAIGTQFADPLPQTWADKFDDPLPQSNWTPLTMTGRMWVIWPVSSNTMTEVEIVWVVAPAREAAPTTAYPPGAIGMPLMPFGNIKAINSPINLPKAAPSYTNIYTNWDIDFKATSSAKFKDNCQLNIIFCPSNKTCRQDRVLLVIISIVVL